MLVLMMPILAELWGEEVYIAMIIVMRPFLADHC